MEQPILYKDIEINQRRFRLKKMEARTGCYMLFKLTKIITPIFKSINLNSLDDFTLDKINITEVASSIFDLPKDEFKYIQDNCLQVIEELLPAGPAKVLEQSGKYGVLDIEFDTGLVMNLTIQSLIFNVSGFFEGSPLSSIIKGLNISQLNSLT